MVASTTGRPSAAPIPEQRLDHLQAPVQNQTKRSKYIKKSEPKSEAMLHSASNSLNSLGIAYFSCRFRQYLFVAKKRLDDTTATTNKVQFQEWSIRLITHKKPVNPRPTMSRSSFSLARKSAITATAANRSASARCKGEKPNPIANIEYKTNGQNKAESRR